MQVRIPLLVAQITGMAVVFGLAMFVPAGTIAWPAGWAFLVLMFGYTIGLSAWLLRFNPELLAERMTGVGHPGDEGVGTAGRGPPELGQHLGPVRGEDDGEDLGAPDVESHSHEPTSPRESAHACSDISP